MKSNFFIDLLWRIITCLSAISICALLIMRGVEVNPEPGSTTEKETSPMKIAECFQDVHDLYRLKLYLLVASIYLVVFSDAPINPGFSTPRKYRKRKDTERIR